MERHLRLGKGLLISFIVGVAAPMLTGSNKMACLGSMALLPRARRTRAPSPPGVERPFKQETTTRPAHRDVT